MILYCPTELFTEESKVCLIIQAAKFFHRECFNYLLKLHADLKAELDKLYIEGSINECPVNLLPFRMDNRSDENLLHHLRGRNCLSIMECLSECSVIVDLINQPYKPEVNMTPLSLAIISGEIQLALEMVKLGGHIDRKNKTGGSPIYDAVVNGDVDLITIMLKDGK